MPSPVASHSTSSAPVSAPGTEIRTAAKNEGSDAGRATVRSAVQELPP